MKDFLIGFGSIILYYLLVATVAIATRKRFPAKSEIFRKLLHLGALCSIFVFLYAFKVWWHAVLACVGFAVVIFPLLHFAQRIPGYATLLVQRKPNEIKWSMVQKFVSFGIVIAVSRGLFSSDYLAIASLFAWGLGDAAAALVGKRFGKHKLTGRLIEGVKSIEGSAAMAVTAFLITLFIIGVKGAVSEVAAILTAAVVAAVSTMVELYTLNGADTITCPLAALTVLTLLLWAFGGITPVWM